MKVIVKSSHMCPTEAFTMASEPFKEDPLIITEMPDLVIHGKS
jgi:DNA polymerase II small subunit/DNA polymerase delta subunit B